MLPAELVEGFWPQQSTRPSVTHGAGVVGAAHDLHDVREPGDDDRRRAAAGDATPKLAGGVGAQQGDRARRESRAGVAPPSATWVAAGGVTGWGAERAASASASCPPRCRPSRETARRAGTAQVASEPAEIGSAQPAPVQGERAGDALMS